MISDKQLNFNDFELNELNYFLSTKGRFIELTNQC